MTGNDQNTLFCLRTLPCLPEIVSNAPYCYSELQRSHAWQDDISIPACQRFLIVWHGECLLHLIQTACTYIYRQGFWGQSEGLILFIDVPNSCSLVLGEPRPPYLLSSVSWNRPTFWTGLFRSLLCSVLYKWCQLNAIYLTCLLLLHAVTNLCFHFFYPPPPPTTHCPSPSP